jgi:ribosomal protein S18 acetylase RimI-like enzyme
MTQLWISESGALAPADSEYVAVNDDGQVVGVRLRLRRGESFPAPPSNAVGWMAEPDALAALRSPRARALRRSRVGDVLGAEYDRRMTGSDGMRATVITRSELLALADARRTPVRRYLQWAAENERLAATGEGTASSLRMDCRSDIRDAAEAAELFPEHWWGVVVFTCFGSKLGTQTVAPSFQHPRDAANAEAKLEEIEFPRGSVGHHRIQATLRGAKQALVAACAKHALFRSVLHDDEDFDARYRTLHDARVRQWGRTTCFDLLLRAGALGVGGKRCLPELAYLAGSTGPRKGFAAVFGVDPDQRRAAWAEAVLREWAEHWQAVAERVGAEWESEPLYPRDQENFLCVYQERLARGVVRKAC